MLIFNDGLKNQHFCSVAKCHISFQLDPMSSLVSIVHRRKFKTGGDVIFLHTNFISYFIFEVA